jgi:adenylate cyclase
MSKATTSPKITPGQKLKYISEQVDRLKELLESTSTDIPSNIQAAFVQISKQMKIIEKEVSVLEGERRDLLALTEIGRIVNSSLQVEDVLRIVMDTIIKLTGAERGFLMLRDDKDELTMRVARNWEQESIQDSDFAISKTVINRVSSEKKAIVTTNAQEDPRFGGQESIIAYGLRSIICVPLIVKDEFTGVFYADNRIQSGIFTESERDLLAAFGDHAAVAIENARLFESIQKTLAEVTELKNMMDNIFSSIASGVITADLDDKITLCNNSAERILGYSAKGMIGKGLNDTLPSLAKDLSNYIKEVRQEDHPILGMELSPTIPERGQLDLLFNLSPLKDAVKTTQGVAIVLDDLTEKKRLEAQRRLFERMVPPAVIDQIDLNKIRLGGERAQITTLFADVRGSTKIGESLTPEELVKILNLHLGAAAEVVLSVEGTLDKFMGDALMAIFNAPIPQKDHTLRAVKAAVGMRAALDEVHSNLPVEQHMGFGIGIHYGDAILGLVGTEKRVDYTAIGDSVNTAKRIQENAAERQILISSEAYQRVKDFIKIKEVEPIIAKGKKEPIKVYEIMDLK